MSDDLTDDELGQIQELSRLFGIPFEELADVWRYNRGERARVDVVSDVLDENHCHGRGDVEFGPTISSSASTVPPVIRSKKQEGDG